MAKKKFTLPADLELDLSGDGLVLRYDGDVALEQTFGRAIDRIEAGGDLRIDLTITHGNVLAGGKLEVAGDVDADVLHAAEVVLGSGSIKARAITASKSITIGAADLKVDVIQAPHIDIAGGAKGRVTVIESHNERGSTKIKGGFSRAEYEELFGDSTAFLAERGVTPLGGASEPARAARAGSNDDDMTEEVSDVAAFEDATEHGTIQLGEGDLTALDDDSNDPASAGIDDPTSDGEGPLFDRLSEAVGRIVACYDGVETPPSVVELEQLVTARDLPALREGITEVWNGLLGFHQQRGIRPHHQVTHAFNVIHGLLQ